jgi:hypothetical protein
MTAADPFTRATPHYVAATRHPFKTGAAWQEFREPIRWGRLALGAALALPWAVIAVLAVAALAK